MPKLPVPGETWVHKEFEDSDMELIPSPIYITGVDVDHGRVFGVVASSAGPGRGESRSWPAHLFCTYMKLGGKS